MIIHTQGCAPTHICVYEYTRKSKGKTVCPPHKGLKGSTFLGLPILNLDLRWG